MTDNNGSNDNDAHLGKADLYVGLDIDRGAYRESFDGEKIKRVSSPEDVGVFFAGEAVGLKWPTVHGLGLDEISEVSTLRNICRVLAARSRSVHAMRDVLKGLSIK